MPRRRAAALATGSFLLALAGLGLAIAQQPPQAAEKKTPTDATAPAPAAPAAAKPEAPAASTPAGSETPAPSKPAAAKGTPQRFEPTEKVRPDFDVAFPIDI